MSTIFAPITAYGKSGIAVIRISGPETKKCLQYLGVDKNFTSHQVRLCKLVNPINKEVIDQSLITFFQSPRSFTGDDVAEINIHNSHYILHQILDLLSKIPDVRLAQAGEFSKIAFLNGKIDLVQAEAIADLIDSETKEQHRQAIKQFGGELSKIYNNWRQELVNITANIEAAIDFPEDDLPEELISKVENKVRNLLQSITDHLGDKRGEKIRNGLSLAILGAPNVGKSSLINYLAKSEVAIVSDIAGTTRDIINVHLAIAGISVVISDTAGLRNTDDVIEKEGVKRAIQKAQQADLKLVILDSSNLDDIQPDLLNLLDQDSLLVINKIDLNIPKIPEKLLKYNPVTLSVKKQINLDLLLNNLEEKVQNLASPSDQPLITRVRYRNALEESKLALTNFLNINDINQNAELAAENLRIAVNNIGKITGKVSVDEMLDVVFSSFCIGK